MTQDLLFCIQVGEQIVLLDMFVVHLSYILPFHIQPCSGLSWKGERMITSRIILNNYDGINREKKKKKTEPNYLTLYLPWTNKKAKGKKRVSTLNLISRSPPPTRMRLLLGYVRETIEVDSAHQLLKLYLSMCRTFAVLRYRAVIRQFY